MKKINFVTKIYLVNNARRILIDGEKKMERKYILARCGFVPSVSN